VVIKSKLMTFQDVRLNVLIHSGLFKSCAANILAIIMV
jgi:hypothetical protein